MWRKAGTNTRVATPALTTLVWLASGAGLGACPICFQGEGDGIASGVRAAVVVLGGVTTAVLAIFVAFTRRILRHESATVHGEGRP
jgi:hypothetical protein